MEESADSSETRPSAMSVSEVFSDHDDDKMEHVEVDGLLDDVTAQEKNKKKKSKHKGGPPSLRRILSFSTSELSKLDEHKAEMQKCAAKSLFKSASFPSNVKLKDNFPLVEGSGDSEDSRDYAMLSSSPIEKISMLTRVTSFPLKSALRGGYEELGIGPRPKLQVKWASSVWEPPCSTVSHTANRSRSKKDPKHVKKGKSSHHDAHKRQDKKKHHKSKCHSGSSNVRACRRHGTYYNDGGKEAESLWQAEILNGNAKPLASHCVSAMALPELESKGPDASDESGNKHAPDVGVTLNSESGMSGGAHYLYESTCGGSLFEPERLACNVLYRQAM